MGIWMKFRFQFRFKLKCKWEGKGLLGNAVFVLLFFICAFSSRAEGNAVALEDGKLKEEIYAQLGKGEGEPLYAEELEEHKGKIRLIDSISIHNGEELDLVRTYCSMGDVYEWQVQFAPDLEGWTQEQLEGLGDLEQGVRITGTKDRVVPASVLPYFTGTRELYFDIRDITGRIPDGKGFPDNVKEVYLDSYASARYHTLLACMRGSGVESLVCHMDAGLATGQGFWLDRTAGMGQLKYLDVGECRIRVGDAAQLEGSRLRQLAGVLDKRTDFSFLDAVPSLEKVTGAVAEEMDLNPLLEKGNLGLRLRFCQEVGEFEEDLYPDGRVVACPEWDDFFGWKEEGEENGNFLAMYQRLTENGRKVECLSVRTLWEDGYMQDVRTFLRVTDGGKVTLLNPEEVVDSEYMVFGEYQRDGFWLEDINFDGVKDIVLDKGSFGNQGAHYEYGWIWDREQEEYVFSESYAEIPNPMADSGNKLVRGSFRNSAGSHSFWIYRYEEGKFVCKTELVRNLLYGEEREAVQAPAGADVLQYVKTEYDGNGGHETKVFYVTVEEGEETEYPEELRRFFE